jgi:outer membrane immunogenic protein
VVNLPTEIYGARGSDMKKLLLLASAFAALFVAPAGATDLPPPAAPVYRPAPIYAPVAFYRWTGCYIGGNGGGLWAHRDWNGTFGFGTFGSQTTSGGLGGFQGGCDYQVGHWVIGVAGDYDWSSASTNNLNNAFPLITNQANTKSLASLTFRTGYAWERFLGYVKGGGAWLRSDLSIQTAGTTLTTVSDNSPRGWTIGVGGEYAFLDWLSAFVEYDYYNFRNDNQNFACTVAVPCRTFINIPVSLNTNVNVIKVGVNVRFGPSTRW